MKPAFKILCFVWLNLFSLAFISCSFFDYNPKMIFVEIQEEQSEDGIEEDGAEIEFMKSVSWDQSQISINLVNSASNDCSTRFLISNTCRGHILVPVKPPLA
ncbi:MAG TPA: hypothetical protein VK177_15460 [Flavobacteriales bacterium]|nr:hypothetical protein [Flavobacteriales bacterium]